MTEAALNVVQRLQWLSYLEEARLVLLEDVEKQIGVRKGTRCLQDISVIGATQLVWFVIGLSRSMDYSIRANHV